MPFNISEFRSSFTTRGEPQRASQFQVLMFPPLAITALSVAGGVAGSILNKTNNPIGVLSDMRMRCNSATFPGKNILTFDYAQTVGPNIKVANGAVYDEFNLEIIQTQSGVERQLVATWLDYIQPVQLGNMDVKFYDTYTGSIILNTYNQKGGISNIVTFVNCFPTAMSSIEYAWVDTDRISTFRVSFAFERIETIAPTALPEGALDLAPLPETSLGDLLNSGKKLLGI